MNDGPKTYDDQCLNVSQDILAAVIAPFIERAEDIKNLLTSSHFAYNAISKKSKFTYLGNGKQIWQERINRFFPYLGKYSEFIDDPETLYQNEFQKLLNQEQPFGITAKQLRLALRGSIDEALTDINCNIITSPLTKDAPFIRLLILSLANDHIKNVMKKIQSLPIIKDSTFNIIMGHALETAAQNGYICAIQNLLDNCEDIAKNNAILKAAENNQPLAIRHILQHLNTQGKSPSLAGRALVIAAEKGFSEVAQEILHNTHISHYYKQQALEQAKQALEQAKQALEQAKTYNREEIILLLEPPSQKPTGRC